MRTWWVWPILSAALAGGVVATVLQQEPPPGAAATTSPVVETTVACPGLRSRAGYTESTVAAATPPGTGAGTGAGTGVGTAGSASAAASVGQEPQRGIVRTLTKDQADSKQLIRLTEPGQRGQYVGRNGERDLVVGRGSGAMAPGFTVTQTERTVDGPGRGIGATQCLPTGADFWFVGAASGVGQTATLVLTNPESAAATVDVDLYGAKGPLDAPAARGVQVAPRSRTDLALAEVAPGQDVLALHVKVTTGRLSAAVTETDVFGREPRGTDWIPVTTPPADQVLLPGVPSVADGRKASVVLDVAAPGETDAVVNVELLTPDGSFTPTSQAVIDVRAGTVASVDLTETLRSGPAAIRLTSDQPVVAGARVVLRRPSAYGDSMYLSGADPLKSAAVVPDNTTTLDLETRLVLTAPGGDVTVQVEAFNGNQRGTRTVTVTSGTTRVVTVGRPQGAVAYGLVVTPQAGSGPFVGTRWLDEEGSRGPLVSSLPLRPARLTALVRPSAPDVATGLSGQVP